MNKVFQLNREIKSDELVEVIVGEFKTLGNFGFHHFNNISNIYNANENSIVFLKKNISEVEIYIANALPKIIICDLDLYDQVSDLILNKNIDKLIIFCKSPRTNFSKIIQRFMKIDEYIISKGIKGIIHDTAIVSKKAIIGSGVSIGAHSIVGNVGIGDETIIGPNVILEDGVNIGKNVLIEANCVIGSKGYSEIIDEDDSNGIHFPQLGGVSIEDNVRIGVGSIVQRGSLQDTIICEGAIIDNNVVIAHNVEIGRYVKIIGSTHIAGSVRIGNDVFIGQSVTIANIGSIGAGAFIGMGSVVTQPILENTKVFGNPAKPIISPVNNKLK